MGMRTIKKQRDPGNGKTRDHKNNLALFIIKPRNGPWLHGLYYVCL